ncbi:ABC transporter ATP-binding protein [Sporosarcina saromensis]|uniref:ABC transporter ATP-binding protein n=1 Tax=Sporosarcina saromensis TaxID=359365 RepID=A0ABU4GDU1_9BACL|nr:ABC transporter ATP-binding protein [Sporosarcina saromensis]MDW0115076.1 ABC transporter ATP-binding protein [Sporosarcina saromensis]
MEKTILDVRNLSKIIKKKPIVNDVSFSIEKGEIFGLLGPNGAGKTTIMKMIMGLQSIDFGSIFYKGRNIKNPKEILNEVGGIIESPNFYPYLSGLDNLKYLASISQKIIDNSDFEYILQFLNLHKDKDVKVKYYSLGMKQRLGIAQALIHKPDLLILDEPMNGLDPIGIIDFRNYLIHLTRNKGTTILISSHIISEIELICDRVVFMNDGKIIDTLNQDEITKFSTKIGLTTNDSSRAIKVLSSHLNLSFENNDYEEIIGEIKKEQITELLKTLIENEFQIYEVKQYHESLESKFLQLAGGNRNEFNSVD